MDINGIFNRPASQGVSDAIQGAADATGASFEYMVAAAQAESGLNPQAASTTSSARGLYQFIDQTWLATLKRAGASLGYGRYADAIVQTAPGRYEVPDPILRGDVMALRDDPAANAAMAGALTRDNAAQLTSRLGRKPTDGELYIAHVLGAAGAAKLTTLASSNLSAPADIAFPTAAEANRSVFYDRQGRARSVAEVRDALVGRFDGARGPAAAPFDIVKAVTGVFAALSPAEAPTGPAVAPPEAAVLAPARAPTVPAMRDAATAPPDQARPAAPSTPAPLFQALFSDSKADPPEFVPNLWNRPSSTRVSPNGAPGGASGLFQAPAADASGLFGR
jgi:hypothetical protein